jgi:hypothetical protein
LAADLIQIGQDGTSHEQIKEAKGTEKEGAGQATGGVCRT